MSLTKTGDIDEHGVAGQSASDIFIDTQMPEPVGVLPRPYSANPAGRGVVGVDPQRLSAGLAPKSRPKNESLIYANELPPAPRSQLDIPFPVRRGVRRQYPRVYKPDECYVGYAKDQGVAAFTCGSGDVKGDGKVFRGNEFAAVYDKRGRGTGLGRDLDIVAKGRVGEAKKQFDRPVVAEGQSLFYPYPSFGNRYYPLYKVYPDTTEYTRDGLPYYHDENKALAGGSTDMRLRDTVAGVKEETEYGVREQNDILENFAPVGEMGAGSGCLSGSGMREGSDGTTVMVGTLVLVGLTLYLLKMRL